ncbi:formin binding protein-like protein [Apodospora peruviana]|uniref:Formin binding protein-like protein n=1 Tax=Apodospora peruviana TaxID=516989 RepID=A0AAE0MGJ5_9PEZI|nr:formin binding protein-like protein [Apodospora peruviana]
MSASFHQPGASVWQEHRTPDGRYYYHNSQTNLTQWTKPEELMTPAERALANQPWKEYTAEGGRKYWYNTETKSTQWEMPDVYKQALGVGTAPAASPTTFASPAGGYGGYGGGSHDRYNDHKETIGKSHQLAFGDNVQAQAFVPESNDPEFATPEEAEAAFVKLLRRTGVQPDWTWEQTLRATMKDPQFRAIKDPRERKVAFEKYCRDVVEQDKEREKERLSKLRTDFATMLRSHPEIKHYTRWKTARPMIEGETIFRSTNNEGERRHLFDDYIVELKRAHKDRQVALRKSAMDGLIDLFPKLNLDPYTRWSEARGSIKKTPEFQHDEKYKALSQYDILTVFQNHVKALERTFNDSKQRDKNRKLRRERQARDAFIALLAELRKDGKIKAGTKWKQIYPLVENDDRYRSLAGQPGSTAVELFWDVIEEEERALRGPRNDVLDVVDDKRFEVTPQTTFEEFEAVVKDDPRTANIERDTLLLILERLQERKAGKRLDDDKHSERQQRRAFDDLRYFLKHLEPPIAVTDTYEQVKSRIAKAEEFKAVTSEEARHAAFEKHIRRLKEREEDAERDRQRRRDRPDGYRDRGERSHRNSGRSARSRSPEQNPYEADRRKAIAERERNYRKSSMAESLLVDRLDRKSAEPHHERDRERRDHRERGPDREREHRDRDGHRDRERDRERERERERERDRDRDRNRDLDRRPRLDELNHYDRERRTREEDRERLYRRRVMDRDVDELPYGDERPSSSRRPRPEEDDYDRKEGRHAKRVKTELVTTREQTPQRDSRQKTMTPPIKKEQQPPSIRAGSEEGEIEED